MTVTRSARVLRVFGKSKNISATTTKSKKLDGSYITLKFGKVSVQILGDTGATVSTLCPRKNGPPKHV